MAKPVTVIVVLDGHVALDLECLDRIYLNAYVPNLQVGGQVVSFLTAHLGYPIPSPAIFDSVLIGCGQSLRSAGTAQRGCVRRRWAGWSSRGPLCPARAGRGRMPSRHRRGRSSPCLRSGVYPYQPGVDQPGEFERGGEVSTPADYPRQPL